MQRSFLKIKKILKMNTNAKNVGTIATELQNNLIQAFHLAPEDKQLG